ncbi:hypothetical protein [Streptomyces sp. OE57]|uniref:hypothetical protein n=1 Tax=Streptomyces lacaronensis TaxID=3379885 RepID=UPI0039B722D2
MVSFLVATYFGLRSYDTLYAISYSSFAFSAHLGPYVAGALHDATGTFTTGPVVALVLLLAAAAAVLFIPRRSLVEPRAHGSRTPADGRRRPAVLTTPSDRWPGAAGTPRPTGAVRTRGATAAPDTGTAPSARGRQARKEETWRAPCPECGSSTSPRSSWAPTPPRSWATSEPRS